jgi:uncharacterized protein YndB with AHSA1/START domain
MVTFDLRTLDRPPVPESRKNTLSVIVDRPVPKVFEFATNPKCTPLWVDGIVREERSEDPMRLGTKYWNVNKQGKWTSYSIVAFEENRVIEFEMDGQYHCRYTFEELPDGKTKLTYSEWATEGKLTDPFQQSALNRFKEVIEAETPIAAFLRKAEAKVEKETEFAESTGEEPVTPDTLPEYVRKELELMLQHDAMVFHSIDDLFDALYKKRKETGADQ